MAKMQKPAFMVFCLDEVVPVFLDSYKGCEDALGLETNYSEDDEETSEIRICQWQTEIEREKTLLHELIHHLDNMLTIKLEETQVRKLEIGLHRMLTQNRWLLSMFPSTRKKKRK